MFTALLVWWLDWFGSFGLLVLWLVVLWFWVLGVGLVFCCLLCCG